MVCFAVVYSLGINLYKFQFLSLRKGINVDYGALFSGKIGKSPLKYLDFPLFARFKEISLWDPVMMKGEKRLASCKGSFF